MSSLNDKTCYSMIEKPGIKEIIYQKNLNYNSNDDAIRNNNYTNKNYVHPFAINIIKNQEYDKKNFNFDLSKINEYEEKKNISINLDSKELVSNKSSRTFFNTNPIEHLVLNSTKEEENASINIQTIEEFINKVNYKLVFLEMQLKEKSEKIKTLEKKLELETNQTKSIQKNVIELNEKVMKIEIAQEMMKLDFKSELEVLKLSIKDEFQKLLDLLLELTKQEKNNIIYKRTNCNLNNECFKAVKNTDFSITNDIQITSPKLESIDRKEINNESHTRVQNNIENNYENPFFTDMSEFSENNNNYVLSLANKKPDYNESFSNKNNNKIENNNTRTNLKNSQYKQESDLDIQDNSLISESKANKIKIKLLQSKEKEKLFNDLDCYSDDLLENTFKNLKINDKKIDNIMERIKRRSNPSNPLIRSNYKNNKNQNHFDTISESTINNLGSKDETFSRGINPISSRRNYLCNSVDAKNGDFKRSIQNATLKQYEAFHYNTILNSVSHLKLKDIDHPETPNQVILRFDEEVSNYNQMKSFVFSEKECNRDSDFVLKSKVNKLKNNFKNEKFDDSLMKILNENEKVGIKIKENEENNIDNLIDPKNDSAKNIDEIYEAKQTANKKSSKNFIEKYKKSQNNIVNKENKSKNDLNNCCDNDNNAGNISLISYKNFAVLSESSNNNTERKKDTIDTNYEINYALGENIIDFNNYEQLILLENLDEKINNIHNDLAGSKKKKLTEADLNELTLNNNQVIQIKNISPIKNLNNTIDCNNNYNLTPKQVVKNPFNKNAKTIDKSCLSQNMNFSILNTSARKTNRNNLSYTNNTNKRLNNTQIKDDILSKNYKNSNLRAFSLALLNNKYVVKDDENKKINFQEFSAKDKKLKEILEHENYEMENQISFEYYNTNENIELKASTIENCNFEIMNETHKEKNLFICRDINNINIESLNKKVSDNNNLYNSIQSFNFTFMKNSINFNSNKNLNGLKDFVIESNTNVKFLKKENEPKLKLDYKNKTELSMEKPIDLNFSMNKKVETKEEKSITNSTINIEAYHRIKVKEISEINKKINEKTHLLIDTSDITNMNNSIQTSKKKGIFNSIFTMKILKHYENQNVVVYAGGENIIKFWDYERNEIIKTLKGHKNHIYCLKQINANLLLSGSLDKTIKLWDINLEKCLKTFSLHTKAVSNLMKINFKLNSQKNDDIPNIIICSAGWEGLVKFFNLEANAEQAEIKVLFNKSYEEKFVNSNSKSKNDKENLFLSEYQKTLDMENNPQLKENCYTYLNKDMKTLIEEKSESNSHNPVTCMKKIKLINEKEIKYLFAVAGKKINIYLIYQRTLLNSNNNNNNNSEKVDPEKYNKYNKLTNSNRSIESQKFIKKIKYELNSELAGHEGYVNDMKFLILDYYFDSYKNTMEKIHLLSVGNDKFIKLWNLHSKQVVKVFSGHNDSVRSLLRIKYFSDVNDRIIASGSADENILIWNLRTGNIIDKLEGHKDGILCLKQIPNKEKLSILSGSGGYSEEPLRIWK